jgi:5-methylcytosine-specific restriction endonuclease McrA
MKCKNCQKETENPKFCSSSCSASYNNKGVRRHGKSHSCLYCGTKINRGKYCSIAHQQAHAYETRIALWKETGEIGKAPLKRYLSEQKEGCWECGITEWNGNDIVLELEHINGNSQDNSEENLSLLCPNCHSQTSTYKNKNKGNGRHYRRERYAQGLSY